MLLYNFSNIEDFHDKVMLLIDLKLFKNKKFFNLYSSLSSDVYSISEDLDFSVEKEFLK